MTTPIARVPKAGTLEARVLDMLDEHEGVESFNLTAGPPGQVRAALGRLARKGHATAVRCPDGAWVWFRAAPAPRRDA